MVSQHVGNLQQILGAIISEGQNYGLELNWDKTVQIQVSTNDQVTRPGGEPIKIVTEAVYLGGLITQDGRVGNELTRRLGESRSTFQQLCKVWRHSSIGKQRKLLIYSSCVLSKLLYSLDSLWLLKADKCRLDAFHCKCLRKIVGIAPSYFSRVSNADVLEKAGSKPLSATLTDHQVQLYRAIASKSDASLVKQLVCDANGRPRNWAPRRRGRGRPRQQWAQCVYTLARVQS